MHHAAKSPLHFSYKITKKYKKKKTCFRKVFVILLALGCRRRDIAFVYSLSNFGTHAIVTVGRKNGSWPGQQAQVMEKYIPLFNPILQEKTMSQRIVANCVPNLK